jgi:hypothetical protein
MATKQGKTITFEVAALGWRTPERFRDYAKARAYFNELKAGGFKVWLQEWHGNRLVKQES